MNCSAPLYKPLFPSASNEPFLQTLKNPYKPFCSQTLTSDEQRRVIQALSRWDEKIRIILNKVKKRKTISFTARLVYNVNFDK